MRSGRGTLAVAAVLLVSLAALPACTDESASDQDLPAIPSEEEAMQEARETIDASNADAEFARLRDDIEADRAAADD